MKPLLISVLLLLDAGAGMTPGCRPVLQRCNRLQLPPRARVAQNPSTGRGTPVRAHKNGREMRVTATAYSPGCPIQGTGWRTATGRHAGRPGVAVDPKIIPLGSYVHVPGYGRLLADDTGGAIRGTRIDIRLTSRGDCLRFGRRTLTVRVERRKRR